MSEGGLEPPRPIRALAPQASASAIPPPGPTRSAYLADPDDLSPEGRPSGPHGELLYTPLVDHAHRHAPASPECSHRSSGVLVEVIRAGRRQVRVAAGHPLPAAWARAPSLSPGGRPAPVPRPARGGRSERRPAVAGRCRRIGASDVRRGPPGDAAHRASAGPSAPGGGRPARGPQGAGGGVRGGRASVGALRPDAARSRVRAGRGGRGVGQPARGPPQLHPGGHRRARRAR